MAVGPATVISPTAPGAASSASDQVALGASSMPMMRTVFAASGRPTQVPAPRSVAARVSSSTSRLSITATGRHSVAP